MDVVVGIINILDISQIHRKEESLLEAKIRLKTGFKHYLKSITDSIASETC